MSKKIKEQKNQRGLFQNLSSPLMSPIFFLLYQLFLVHLQNQQLKLFSYNERIKLATCSHRVNGHIIRLDK